eukprot:366022-Chlamydomonas_euryale.AAC.4
MLAVHGCPWPSMRHPWTWWPCPPWPKASPMALLWVHLTSFRQNITSDKQGLEAHADMFVRVYCVRRRDLQQKKSVSPVHAALHDHFAATCRQCIGGKHNMGGVQYTPEEQYLIYTVPTLASPALAQPRVRRCIMCCRSGMMWQPVNSRRTKSFDPI